MLVKSKLEMELKSALEEGFKCTFLLDSGDEGDEMANAFATKAAKGMATAIDAYIKSATITALPNTVMGVCPPTGGPLTAGVISIPLDIK